MSNDNVAADQLRAFIERIEHMEEERLAIVADIKEIKAEAKGNGFSVAVINEILKIRRKDHSERMEFEAILDLYMDALGMSVAPRDPDDTPPRGRRSEPEHRSAPLKAASDSITFDADGVEIEQPETANGKAGDAFAAVMGKARLADAVGVEPSPAAQTPEPAIADQHVAVNTHGEGEGATNALPTAYQSYHAPTALSSDVVKMPTREEGILRVRPNCQNPGACKSSGGKKHCWSCSNSVSETTTGGAA